MEFVYMILKHFLNFPTPRAKEMDSPSSKTFTDAYKVIEIGSMPNKTRETSIQELNRTIWTNKKAFRSGIAENATCNRCEEEETR
jgi:hypothetical protein